MFYFSLSLSLIIGIWLERNNYPERVLNKISSLSSVYVEIPIENLVNEAITDDPLSEFQWNLRMVLNGLDYRELLDAPNEVVIAVIDRGFNLQHPDIEGQFLKGYDFVRDSSIISIKWDGNPPNASNLHGQCSASIIAAIPDNQIGIAGVFPQARIMPIVADIHTLHKAIQYAQESGVDIIQISGGGSELVYPTYNPETRKDPHLQLYSIHNIEILKNLKNSIGQAYDMRIPIVTGVGNTMNWENYFFPADYRTIAVGPHDILGTVSDHLSWSFTYEIFAPGGSRNLIKQDEISIKYSEYSEVLSSGSTADYDDPLCAIGSENYSFLTLGSAAIPHVTGGIALIKSYYPNATVEDIRRILRNSTVPLNASGNLFEGIAGRISLRLILHHLKDSLGTSDMGSVIQSNKRF